MFQKDAILGDSCLAIVLLMSASSIFITAKRGLAYFLTHTLKDSALLSSAELLKATLTELSCPTIYLSI